MWDFLLVSVLKPITLYPSHAATFTGAGNHQAISPNSYATQKIYFAPWKPDYGLLGYLQIQLRDHGMVSHVLNMLNKDIWN
jgi:hypothetical protein